MPKTDPRVDAYIAKSTPFAQPILKHFRALVHRVCPSAEETFKWGMPFFQYHGLLCNMGAFKAHCAIGFWRGTELFGEREKDEKGQAAMGRYGKITSMEDLPSDSEITRHLKKSMALNEAGPKRSAPRPAVKKPVEVPRDFLAALKKNKSALAVFQAFSPSHQREYVEWIVEAKREETRQTRIASALDLIAEGKSRHWKYRK